MKVSRRTDKVSSAISKAREIMEGGELKTRSKEDEHRGAKCVQLDLEE